MGIFVFTWVHVHWALKKLVSRDFSGGPVVEKSDFHVGDAVRSWIGELRPHLSWGTKCQANLRSNTAKNKKINKLGKLIKRRLPV